MTLGNCESWEFCELVQCYSVAYASMWSRNRLTVWSARFLSLVFATRFILTCKNDVEFWRPPWIVHLPAQIVLFKGEAVRGKHVVGIILAFLKRRGTPWMRLVSKPVLLRPRNALIRLMNRGIKPPILHAGGIGASPNKRRNASIPHAVERSLY